MTNHSIAINKQYGQANLSSKIGNALVAVGKNLDVLTLDDLASFDQLHFGGRDATRAMANLAGVQPGMKVLDIGSGVGGPARTLASEFGCRVVGLDITDDFVEAARMLTAEVGLTDTVSFQTGNALDLPFDDEAFDAAWSQNTIMNIKDKETVVREAWRVLRREGILVMEAVMAGPKDGLEYPVFWANDPEISFLETPEEFRQLMAESGFYELDWKDVTQRVIEGGRRRQATRPEERPALGIDVIYDDVPVKLKNTMRGLKEGHLVDIYAVYRRAP